jgi:hypothetical protein
VPELGSAYYRIYADTKDFSRGLKRAEKDANDATRGVSKSLRGMDRDVERSTERTHKLSSAFEIQKDEVSGLLVVIDKAKRSTRESTKTTTEHERSVGRLSRTYTSLRTGLAGLTAQMRTHKKESDGFTKTTDKNVKGIFRFNQAVTLMGHIFKVIKFPAIIAGVGYLTSAFSAATAGVVAFTSALGPMVGALGAAPQLLGTLAQAAITVKLGFMGVGEAMKDSMKEFKKPGPAAQKFGSQLSGMLPGLAKFRDSIQAAFLPKVWAGLQSAGKNASVFQKVFVGTGSVIGSFAQNFGKLVGSKGFGRDFEQLGNTSNKILTIMGGSLIQVTKALTHVAVAAQPLTMWLVKLTHGWADSANAAARSGRESGRMAAFFEKTRTVLTRVGNILGRTTKALFNIGKASSDLGGDLLLDLSKLTKRWEEWTGSIEGQNSLKKWFAESKAPLYQFLGLLGDITKMVFKVGGENSAGLTALFVQIRKELLPVIGELLNSTTKSFGPVLVNTLVQLTKAATLLAGSNGPLVVMVKGLGSLAQGLNDLLEKVPELRPLIFTLVGLAGAAKGLSILGKITGISKFASAIFGLTKAGQAAKAAGGIMPALFGAGGAAAGALPWVAGIVAAGVALYVLYKKVGWFREAVNTTAAALKVGFVAALNWTKQAVKDVITEVQKWHFLFTVVKGIFEGIKIYLGVWFKVLMVEFRVAFAVLKPIVTAAWEGVKQAFMGAITVIGGLVKVITGIFRGDFGRMWSGIKQMFSGGVQYLLGVLRAASAPVRVAATKIWEGIKAGVSAAWGFVKKAAETGIGAIKGIISGAYGGLKSMGSTLWKKVGEGISAAVGGVKSLFIGAVNSVLGVAESFVNGIISIINKLPFVPDVGPVHFPRIGGGGGSNNAEADRGRGVGTGKKNTLQPLAQGGAITSPIVMMGEEAPRHHEWVIATNPAYRNQNIEYWAQAGHDLGVSGFGIGGLLNSAWDGAKSAAGGVVSGAAKKLLGLMPGNPFTSWPMKDFAGGMLGSAGKKVGGNKGLQALGKMIDYGTAFGARGTPYDYGGGHGAIGAPGARGGFDCSGYVSAILHAGGLLNSPLDTVGLRGALQGGSGQYVTVGVRGGAGKSGHTMMSVSDGSATNFFESGGGHGARKVGGWNGAFDKYHPQGFAKGGYFGKYSKNVTVKGQRASKSQRSVLGRAMELATRWKVPYKAKKALISALIVESEAGRLNRGDHDSYGVLQARDMYWPGMSTDEQIGAFLGHGRGGKRTKYRGFTGKGSAHRLAKTGMSSGRIAQTIEGSAFPGRYATHGKEASRIIRAYNSANRKKPKKKKSTAKGAPRRLTRSVGDPGTTGYRSASGTGQGYTALRGDLPAFYSNWYARAQSTSDTRDDVQWMTAYLAYLRASVGSLVDMRARNDPRFAGAYQTFWGNVDALTGLGMGLPGVRNMGGNALTNAVLGIASYATQAGIVDPRTPAAAEGDPGPEPMMPGDSGIRSAEYEAWLEAKWGQAQMTRDKSDDNAVLAKAHAYYDPRADYVQGPDWIKPPGLTADEELLAQRTKDELHTIAMTGYIDRLVGAVLNSPGGGAGAGPAVIFQSYVPPSPREARRLADYTIGGIGYQGGIPSSTNRISQ